MRLQKYLAKCGVASRRKSEELIRLGEVTVNNIIIKEMGYIIEPSTDIVSVNGKKITEVKKKKFILHSINLEVISLLSAINSIEKR